MDRDDLLGILFIGLITAMSLTTIGMGVWGYAFAEPLDRGDFEESRELCQNSSYFNASEKESCAEMTFEEYNRGVRHSVLATPHSLRAASLWIGIGLVLGAIPVSEAVNHYTRFEVHL